MSKPFRGSEPSDSVPPPSEAEATVTSYAFDRPGFSVRVDGGFVDSGKWMIHGVVAYGSHLTTGARRDVEIDARRALVLAVARDTRSARELGARAIYVLVEGDDQVAGFFRMLDAR
jgi:hypothetical protein